jgi:hypothetical protein
LWGDVNLNRMNRGGSKHGAKGCDEDWKSHVPSFPFF